LAAATKAITPIEPIALIALIATAEFWQRYPTACIRHSIYPPFHFPLPVNVICQLLDVSVQDGVKLGSAASHFGNALEAAPTGAAHLAAANEAALKLERYFKSVIEDRCDTGTRNRTGHPDLAATGFAHHESRRAAVAATQSLRGMESLQALR